MGMPNKKVTNLKGENGGQYCKTAAKAYTPAVPSRYFDSFTCTEAGVFALVSGNITGDATTAVTLPAGLTIHGKFTSITPASGAGFAYNGDVPSQA